MLHCAMQTAFQNTGTYSSQPLDCSFKLKTHTQYSDKNTHLKSEVSCHRNTERKPPKDPQQSLFQVSDSAIRSSKSFVPCKTLYRKNSYTDDAGSFSSAGLPTQEGALIVLLAMKILVRFRGTQ